jgi:exopolysaccharide production protein ExoZ
VINNLQILRGFAAFNVVLHHIAWKAGQENFYPNILSFFGGWGMSGVDIFFVISGFVMCYTQFKVKSSPLNFVKARLKRIVPIYWIVTSLILFLFFLDPGVIIKRNFTSELISSSYLFYSYLMNDIYPIIVQGWTLELEILFYVVFAVSLNFRNLKLVIISAAIILSLITIFTKQFLLIEFIFGMLIAYIYNQIKFDKRLGLTLLIIGIFFLFFSIKFNLNTDSFSRIFFWGIPSALIVIGSVFGRQINNSILLYLGNASYSIYLVHLLTIVAFYEFSSIFLRGYNGDILAIFCFALSIVSGCFFYSFVEKPIITFFKKK